MRSPWKERWEILKEVRDEFNRDNCPHLAAALSYYTLFSLAPLLILVIAVSGIFFGREAVTGEVFRQLRGLIGPQGALAVQEMIRKAYTPNDNFWAAAAGGATLLVGATSVFIQIQDALDIIWGVRPRASRSPWKILRDRMLSFGMVLGLGFLLLVSLLFHAILSALGGRISAFYPHLSIVFLKTLETAVSIGVTTLLFAMLFKFLPDVRIRWRDVWTGAFVTSALFAVGKIVIGLYLGSSRIASTYGAAAAVMIVIVWVNYSSLIVFLGAEFTQAFARRRGADIVPAEYAVPVEKGGQEVLAERR
ncbi:MAG TPA: YihY/virulence factor BrkB family protein [Candidatus Eisenbacteria bacterium]|jgi:membrane protein|nr:YihY/virulence factor BrkB family protein [Candidatus Eisenbacteria bacterium]